MNKVNCELNFSCLFPNYFIFHLIKIHKWLLGVYAIYGVYAKTTFEGILLFIIDYNHL